ncbi:MAG: MarR family transcriptional regulator [Hydrogenophaga sp.]|nr:MarR family transcriptional regulator [Hydrogenophaga sp.]
MAEPSTARSLKRTSWPRKAAASVGDIDTSYLESLTGYNARRAALTIISVFLDRMAQYELRPVDFSVLSLIAHNPGITSRQLCGALDMLPPNLVGMLRELEGRGVIEKREHPTDRRAQGLHLSAAGKKLYAKAQRTATELEVDALHDLSAEERETLHGLLRRVYRPQRKSGEPDQPG